MKFISSAAVMRRTFFCQANAAAAVLLWLFFIPVSVRAQNWYRSNQAGMALERVHSRMVALHHEWALLVESANRSVLPPLLRPYDNLSYTLEQRLLYERGRLKRRQWIFLDARGLVRLNASLPADIASIGKAENQEIPAFIDIFASDQSLTETHQFLVSGVYITRYSYRDAVLIKSETFLDNTPLWTDSYRYTRAAMLRGVERHYHEAGMYAASIQGTSSQPPLPLTNLDLRSAPPIPGFINPGTVYDNSIMTEVLGSIFAVAARVVYDTDNLGRVITETRYDEEDKILAVISNEWSNDKINVIHWSAPPDQGRIVFRYSGNDRISEENYRNGILERTVKTQGDEEIEEIFINGRAILRTVWKDGRKQSEERLR